LENYFNSEGKISIEKWVEKNFSDFELHGQLDVIIETDKKVEVFDYKTREAMSENAIKGQTRDSDGNYFRQLIFYKILLEKKSGFGDKEIIPALVFVKPDSAGRCPIVTLPISEKDTERVKSEIDELAKSVFSGAFLRDFCDDSECKWCAMKKEFSL